LRKRQGGLQFESSVDKRGRLAVPRHILDELGPLRTAILEVRLTERRLSRELSRRGIREEEVDRVASVQLESREPVIRFLLAEGSLTGKRGRTRRRAG